MTAFEELQDAYDEYQTRARQTRKELMRELEDALEDRLRPDTLALSQKMHQARAEGMRMLQLRKAVRKAGDPEGFNALFNAYDPGVKIDLRRKEQVESDDVAEQAQETVRWVGENYVVVVGEREYTLENLSRTGEEVTWDNYLDHLGPDYIRLVELAGEAFDKEDEK